MHPEANGKQIQMRHPRFTRIRFRYPSKRVEPTKLTLSPPATINSTTIYITCRHVQHDQYDDTDVAE